MAIRTVGFIGLGLMGLPMSSNILKKGFPLTVYNRTKTKTIQLQKMGARVATSPRQVAELSDVVIIMVTGPREVEEVLMGRNGIIESQKKGLAVIDMSTIGLTAARAFSKKLEGNAIDFIDAPVTGSTPKAITGELTIFVGGKKEVFEKVKKLLGTMGKQIHYMGSVGSGQAIKLINNYIIAVSMLTLGESMLLADAMRLSRKRLGEVLTTVPAVSPMMQLKMPNFLTNTYPLLFSTANMRKDIDLAFKESKKGQLTLPMLRLVYKMFDEAMIEGLGDKDYSTVVKVIENLNK
jgi:3-hydroxyisobutyrate dehydrogenase